jgi:hypothetical protein
MGLEGVGEEVSIGSCICCFCTPTSKQLLSSVHRITLFCRQSYKSLQTETVQDMTPKPHQTAVMSILNPKLTPSSPSHEEDTYLLFQQ